MGKRYVRVREDGTILSTVETSAEQPDDSALLAPGTDGSHTVVLEDWRETPNPVTDYWNGESFVPRPPTGG